MLTHMKDDRLEKAHRQVIAHVHTLIEAAEAVSHRGAGGFLTAARERGKWRGKRNMPGRENH